MLQTEPNLVATEPFGARHSRDGRADPECVRTSGRRRRDAAYRYSAAGRLDAASCVEGRTASPHRHHHALVAGVRATDVIIATMKDYEPGGVSNYGAIVMPLSAVPMLLTTVTSAG